jgi:hypothetical protein
VSAVDGRAGHPSALALERYALGIQPREVAAHIASCETCRGSVERAATSRLEVPAWARGLGPRRGGSFSSWPWPTNGGSRVLPLGIAALACVAVVGIAGLRSGDGGAGRGYVGAKGGPGLRLFVKHGARVSLWDPAVTVVAGDLLRLEVQPDRFVHVSVFAATRPPGGYARLYDAPIAPGRPTALPSSWEVDAQPGDETLVVALGPDSMTPDDALRLLSGSDDSRHWVRRIVVAKAGSWRRSADGQDGAAP